MIKQRSNVRSGSSIGLREAHYSSKQGSKYVVNLNLKTRKSSEKNLKKDSHHRDKSNYYSDKKPRKVEK